MRIVFTALYYRLAVWTAFIILPLYLLPGYSCLAQEPVFHHLDARDGLAQNSVFAITQDSRGFMWFCTTEGVNRYDSRSFRLYKNDPANQGSISSDYTALSLYDSQHTLWIGTSKGLNKYDPSSDSFQRILHDPAVKSSLSDDRILCIYEDSKGTLWVSTAMGLDRLVDRATNRFEHYFPTKSSKLSRISSIAEDQAGNLWLGTYEGLVRLTVGPGGFRSKVFRHDKNVPASLGSDFVTCLVKDAQHNLWIGTKNGELDRYDPAHDNFIHFRGERSAGMLSAYNEINCLYADKTGNVWIGTVEGMIRLELSTLQFTRYQNDPDNPQSLSDNNVYSIFQDKEGSIWVGTYYAGVDVLHPDHAPFRVLKAGKSNKGLTSKWVNYITEDIHRNLWIGVDGEGLDFIDRQTGLIRHFEAGQNLSKDLPSNQIKDIYVDKENYTWVAMRRGGLSRLDPAHRQWTSYHYSPDKNFDNVVNILEDSQQRFWCLSGRNLTLFNKQKGTFERFQSRNNRTLQPDTSIDISPISSSLEDSHKNVWFGGEAGVYLLRYKSSQVEWMPCKRVDRNGKYISQVEVCSIHEDKRNRLWISASRAGLKQFDPAQKQFIDYSEVKDLVDQQIAAIQSDDQGILWLSTIANGLVRFDPEKKMIWRYTASDGIPGSEFETNGSYRGRDGKLYFGTNDGLLYFDPSAIKINTHPPTVVFTALEVDNKAVTIGDKTNLLTKDIGLTDQLTFNYQQNFFTIDFAVLNYIKSEKNQYAYKLDGLDKEWHMIKTPSITYNNLPAGEYTLWVKGANNDGVWSIQPTKLRLVVLPPWWRSWWAYSLYALAFGILLYMVLRFFWLQDSFKRERELNQAKLDFFTNISHEIRTHLTLIIGPIDLLLSTKQDDRVVQRQMTYAKNSSESLLNLVSELITFRKAESDQLELHVSQNDVVSFLKNIMASFLHHSEQRNIQLSFSSNSQHIELDFDPSQIEKVIYNLLSNAFKFMSDGGSIRIDVVEKEGWVSVAISDTGRGISAENVKKLFTNYFQVHDYGTQNTGYGIGLALSRRIAELHGGTLTVESKEARNGENGFTCFTLRLKKERSKTLTDVVN